MPKLVIFLSYATEDQQIATTLANKLSSAFGRAVDLRYMSKFELGVNFRTTIDQALDAAKQRLPRNVMWSFFKLIGKAMGLRRDSPNPPVSEAILS